VPYDIAPSIRPGQTRRGLQRAVVALLVAAVLALALPAGDALAGTPRTYSPRHVWQLKDNCVWAAGQMLVDKWTHGRVRVYQARLRRASGDKKGGSSLYDLSKGIARLTGIHLRASPGLGDSMTWWQLLDRLEHGGGAVLIGEYKRMPAHYTRWDPSFARKASSSHAVYVERYDRANARVWLMDPLAEGAYPGEWIAVTALRRFASFKGTAVVAAATPARHHPRTAPLIDSAYLVGTPSVGRTAIAGSTLKVRVPLKIRFGFPAPSAQRFVATWEPVVDAIAARTSARSRAVVDTASTVGDQPEPVRVATATRVVRSSRRGFANAVPVPDVPGRYRVTLGLAEGSTGGTSRRFSPIEVTVIGPYAATWSVQAPDEVTAGASMAVKVALTNIGTLDWRTPKTAPDAPRPAAVRSQTLMVLQWVAPGQVVQAATLPAEVAPGGTIHLKLRLAAPTTAGPWTLSMDLVNLEQGSMASTGLEVPNLAVMVDPKGLAGEP
jgi:hypothetical protein